MSLKLPSASLSSFTVRLSLWYALVFTISAGILFWLLYLLLAAALERKDHEVIETRLKACAAIYEGTARFRGTRPRGSEDSRFFCQGRKSHR
jgi:hypothetical protein